jgi:site-specific DNA recombinase
MQVACYARVSTGQQQHEGTIESQRRVLKLYIHHQSWSLLPEHEYSDEGISGARLDRPALDRLRDAARRGEFDAVVILSPDRLARNYAHQWLLVEEFTRLNTQVIFLQNPFGDSPQGKLLAQMQGMIAEYERAQIAERTRRGRLEKARRGEFMPWAYRCYGYRYLPKRHGCAAQVMIEPSEAEVIRALYRALVEEQLSCRQITKRLNASNTSTPTGKNHIWQLATVRNILTNRVYAGQARYNYRRPVVPQHRKMAEHQLRSLKTGRSYRLESEGIWSEAPAIITVELFEKAQRQLRRNAETARKMYQPASGRYLLRTLVKCGECGLGMVGIRHLSPCKKYDYLYYQCAGHTPLTVGRPTKCPAKLVRAERLDAVVWQALEQLLRNPSMIPHLHQTWAAAKQQTLSGLEAQQSQLLQRRQRIERQDQRLLDAYQAEIITLRELQTRRQKLAATLQQIAQESRQLAHTRQQSVQWQQVIDNATTFRQLLGTNLEQLSFAERQAIAQCLISKIVVTGEEVDAHFVLPFDSTPQVSPRLPQAPEGTPGHFYRLRLAHFHAPAAPHQPLTAVERLFQRWAVFDDPLVDGRMIHVDPTFAHEFFNVARAQRVVVPEYS